MTVLITFDVPATMADLEAIRIDMDVEANPPDGLIAHVATQGDGLVHIVDIWASEEQYSRFGQERLGPAIAKRMAVTGHSMDGPPVAPVVTEAFDLVRGR